MATAARPAVPPQSPAPSARAGESAAPAALVPAAPLRPAVEPSAAPFCHLPVEVEVGVPVRDFRVRNLLALEPGTVVESRWKQAEDLPIAAGSVQLAWSEFEVVDTQLAVRLTRMA